MKAALARVDQAVYSVRLLQKAIQDCTVRAPSTGIVTEKLVEEGELAAPGTGLYVITDLDTVKLTIYVPETELGNLRLGQKGADIHRFPSREPHSPARSPAFPRSPSSRRATSRQGTNG